MRGLTLFSLCVFACGGSTSIDEGTYVASDIMVDDGCAIFNPDEIKATIEVTVTGSDVIFDGAQAFPRVGGGFAAQSESEVDARPGLDCVFTVANMWVGDFMGSDLFAFSKEISYTPIMGAQCNQVLMAPMPCTSTASAVYTLMPIQ